jgi:hypothetical protein
MDLVWFWSGTFEHQSWHVIPCYGAMHKSETQEIDRGATTRSGACSLIQAENTQVLTCAGLLKRHFEHTVYVSKRVWVGSPQQKPHYRAAGFEETAALQEEGLRMTSGGTLALGTRANGDSRDANLQNLCLPAKFGFWTDTQLSSCRESLQCTDQPAAFVQTFLQIPPWGLVPRIIIQARGDTELGWCSWALAGFGWICQPFWGWPRAK